MNTTPPLVTAVSLPDQSETLRRGPAPLRRVAMAIGELLATVGLVVCVPLVILAIGIPIALVVRFLLWIVGIL